MELTCWWNQLWIIFMNMKSITAAASNPSTLFIFLWEWKMKWSWWNCCFAAQPLIKRKVYFSFIEGWWESEPWNHFFFFLNWWVMAGLPAMAPPRRENKEEMIEWVSEPCCAIWWMEFVFLFSLCGGYGRCQRQCSAKKRKQKKNKWNEINGAERQAERAQQRQLID